MTSTATPPSATDADQTTPRRRRRERRRRRTVLWSAVGVVLLVLLGLGVWAAWLATGLLDASRTVQDRATVAQGHLQAFRDTLKAGDEAAAGRELTAAETAIAEAKDAAQAAQVRQAKGLPYVGATVADLDHLLAAAGIMTDTGRDAIVVYRKFSGANSELFNQGAFSIPAIREAQASVKAIQQSVGRAEAELQAVTGEGPKGGDILIKKQSGLDQIASLKAEIEPLEPVLEALPTAVGEKRKVKYLVAIMNPAEMRASGGAPLSIMIMSFKNGKMDVELEGTTSTVTLHSPTGLLGDSPELVWPRVKGDPYQPALGKPQRFVNASFNPDFSVSGEQLRRATPTFFGHKTDGVVALDLVAISHLMKVTGPIESRYGLLTPENVVQRLLVRAYKEQGAAIGERQAENDRLMQVMRQYLVGGGGLMNKARALGEAVPGRHLQMYFQDDRLQQLVEEKSLGGEVPNLESGNLAAVFTQNGNGSKLDVFQNRTVGDDVRLREDGSAVVTRTVTIDNDSPRYVAAPPDPRRGYNTRWATNLVINVLPKGAEVTKQPDGVLPKTVETGTDREGRTFAKAAVVTRPKGTSTVTWTYTVPKAAEKTKEGWRFASWIVPQGMLRTPTYELRLRAPEGWSISNTGKRWTGNDGASATVRVPMERLDVVRARVTPE